MPIEYTISNALDLAYARWTGCVHLEEFREMFAAYLEDVNYVHGRRELCDFSGVTDMDVSLRQIWSVLSLVNSHEKGMQVKTQCVVFAPNDTVFGFARMYQSLSENYDGIQVTVCREEREALLALTLSSNTLDEMRKDGNFMPPTFDLGRTGVAG